MSRQIRALRAIVWFAFHPDESLTARDMDIKLGLPRKAVNTLLANACRDGLLRKHRPDNSPVVYSAGPPDRLSVGSNGVDHPASIPLELQRAEHAAQESSISRQEDLFDDLFKLLLELFVSG